MYQKTIIKKLQKNNKIYKFKKNKTIIKVLKMMMMMKMKKKKLNWYLKKVYKMKLYHNLNQVCLVNNYYKKVIILL